MDIPKIDSKIQALRKAAFIAGFAVLIMALTVPLVEFYIFPKLIDYTNGEKTTNNIAGHLTLFSAAIFIHFVTVICDIVAAWALYIFLKPANKNLALLSAWFRIVNTAFTIAALANLLHILTILKTRGDFTDIHPGQLNDQVLFYLESFNLQWRFMLVFFGFYLNLLGWLVLKADYIPKIMGLFLIIAGLGYIIDDLKYFFYPHLNLDFLWLTYLGELVFMFWLLISGPRIQHLNKRQGSGHKATSAP